MKKTLGILGGMGPMATADLLIKIVSLTRADSDAEHIRIFIDNNAQIPDRTAALLAGGADPVPEMLSALRNLEKCGADLVVMPCNTAHCFLPQLQAVSDTPFLSMPEISARRCAELYPGKTACVLATRGVLATGLYDRVLDEAGVRHIEPDEREQDYLMHLIYDVVKATRPMQPEEDAWAALLEGLRRRGAKVFLLACTELPIVANSLSAEGPFLDPTQELARAAVLACGYELNE